jgi:methyl-accepting chemotaxis protein
MQNRTSQLLAALIGFGVAMGLVFPVYANFFVVWRPGMFVPFALGSLVAGLVVGLVNHGLMNRIIGSQLRGLSNHLARVTAGDLASRQPVVGDDYLAMLSKRFNQMTEQLDRMTSQIGQVSFQVTGHAAHVADSTAAMDTAIRDVATTAEHLAVGATQQASLLQDAADIVNALSETAGNLTGAAKEAVEAGALATTCADSCRTGLDAALSGIDAVRASVTTTQAQVAAMGEASNRISAVLEIIRSIASQTNLLALNASIEAARAGDSGRGFAVVADEIRKLAHGSAESADSIAAMVTNLQQQTQDAVAAMALSAQATARGSQDVNAVATTVATMVDHVRITAQHGSAMADGVAWVANSLAQVDGQIADVVRLSDQASSSAESIAAAMQEQSAAMEEVAGGSRQLAGISDDLAAMVGRFRIDQAGTTDRRDLALTAGR